MPELPEVEAARRVAARFLIGRRILRATCAADPIVLGGVPSRRLERALSGARILGVARYGKHLWFELDRKP